MTDTIDASGMAQPSLPKASSSSDALKSFVSGGFGGVCLVLVGHPFDLVKVRIQTGASYTSTFSAFRSILSEDGLRGLYRGMSTPLIGIAPIFAVCFWGYDMGQRLVGSCLDWCARGHREGKELSLTAISVAGGFSALPTTLIMTPTERIKVMLQTQTLQDGQPRFRGPIDAIKSVVGPDGLRGAMKLYQGTLATLCRDVPGSVAYFAAYEGIKKGLMRYFYAHDATAKLTVDPSARPTLPVFAILLAGGLAGMANWIVAIPADVIKSRIQAHSGPTSLSGMVIFSQLLRQEGPGALFKGLGPALIRAFPANAACFMGVEMARRALHSL